MKSYAELLSLCTEAFTDVQLERDIGAETRVQVLLLNQYGKDLPPFVQELIIRRAEVIAKSQADWSNGADDLTAFLDGF